MGLFGCEYLEASGSFFTEYRCKYTRQILDSRTAQDICSTNRYLDCADYRNAARCFITTAVCLTLGKADDCEELTVMRNFRDEWLRNQLEGEKLIEEYYDVAPEIVKKIDKQPERKLIYATIYDKYIKPCVDHAKAQNFEASRNIYVDMVNDLKVRYIE